MSKHCAVAAGTFPNNYSNFHDVYDTCPSRLHRMAQAAIADKNSQEETFRIPCIDNGETKNQHACKIEPNDAINYKQNTWINPCQKWNYGNPVFTCDNQVMDKYKKYGELENGNEWTSTKFQKRSHPLYRTTNSDYGSTSPSIECFPITRHPKENKYSDGLAKCGIYRNQSLNTGMDKTVFDK